MNHAPLPSASLIYSLAGVLAIGTLFFVTAGMAIIVRNARQRRREAMAWTEWERNLNRHFNEDASYRLNERLNDR
jgi:hypothetical protein